MGGSADRPPRRCRRDRGSATLEIVALVPMVMVVLLLGMQLLAVVYTANAASQAARDAARAYSLGQSPVSAAEASLPGSLSLVSVDAFGPDHGVRVVVEAPSFVVIADRDVTREVVMP
ncbi:TadE/TadG family type IV pilus assembly protein [Naumannella halotolerans]|uniref:TadE-like protein n=1 Tax=Naumannella halotolerans TaxID=993414 RepID=A0A4R7J4G6_9ACTN|nr:TadE/TadG family type IV pilus assembly protein [Naumannella halotolerans]TDT31277.1 TadE-like protein [Naumannella halotolerans]